MKPKYALHPGYITSRHDGDRHYINEDQLAYLYGLRRGEYIVWDERTMKSFEKEYIHLFPNYYGHYELPDKPMNKHNLLGEKE